MTSFPGGLPQLLLIKLWVNKVKGDAFEDIFKTFGDNPGIFSEFIILANSTTSNKLTSNQVLTDKGIYSLFSNKTALDVGYRYKLITDSDTIAKDCGKSNTIKNILVESVDDNGITYKSGEKLTSLTLPEKTTYYYNGVKQNYENLKNIIFHGFNNYICTG
jgi:hypothetical protein